MTPTNAKEFANLLRDFADEIDPPATVDQKFGAIDTLLNVIGAMQEDWQKLNRFYNATAMRYGWCSDWEERIRRYNNEFRVLKLQGRVDQGRFTPGAIIEYEGSRVTIHGQNARPHYMLSEDAVRRLSLCDGCIGRNGNIENSAYRIAQQPDSADEHSRNAF